MTKYRIAEQLHDINNASPVFTIYKKRWFGWRHLKTWFHSAEDAQKHLTKCHLMKGEFPILKEIEFV
jgi:hypothetical protein